MCFIISMCTNYNFIGDETYIILGAVNHINVKNFLWQGQISNMRSNWFRTNPGVHDRNYEFSQRRLGVADYPVVVHQVAKLQ